MPTAEELKLQGNKLYEQQQYDKALEKYDEAIALDPKLSAVWLNKGIILKKLGRFEPALEALTESLKLNPNYPKADYLRFFCEQQLAARIVFGIVDLKLTPAKQIKILEFGRGLQSAFVGLKIATGQDIRDVLKASLDRLSLPLILTSIPGAEVTDERELNKFIAKSETDLTEPALKALSDFHAVYGGATLKPVPRSILCLDDAAADYIFENKRLSHQAFVDTSKTQVRPRTVVIPRSYSAALPKQIRAQLAGVKQFVIKAPDMECGQGVVVVKDADLELILKVLCAKSIEEASKTYATHSLSAGLFNLNTMESSLRPLLALHNSDDPNFVVEEYIAGKPVAHNDAQYDATMRVAFVFTRDQDEIKLEPIACYWKLPPQAMTQQGELRARTVSSYTEGRHDSQVVAEDDMAVVYQQLKEHLPVVLDRMTKQDLFAQIGAYPETTAQEKQFKIQAWLHWSNTLSVRAEYNLAEYCLENALKIDKANHKIYHQQGIHYGLKGDDQKALDSFQRALAINPRFGATYYRRGVLLHKLNKFTDAERDFADAIKVNPSMRAKVTAFMELQSGSIQRLATVNIGPS